MFINHCLHFPGNHYKSYEINSMQLKLIKKAIQSILSLICTELGLSIWLQKNRFD